MENNRWKLYAGAVIGVLAFVAIGSLIVFTILGWWPVVVDIVLAFTALASMAMLLVLILAVFFFIRMLREFKAEITPVLESLKATSNAVQATASTASNFGVKPAIRTASFVVGAGEVASLVLGRGHARKRSEKRQRRRHEIERELASEPRAEQLPRSRAEGTAPLAAEPRADHGDHAGRGALNGAAR